MCTSKPSNLHSIDETIISLVNGISNIVVNFAFYTSYENFPSDSQVSQDINKMFNSCCQSHKTFTIIICPDDLLRLLHFGNGNRTQHPTDANKESSRSHAVFQVCLVFYRNLIKKTVYACFKPHAQEFRCAWKTRKKLLLNKAG